MSLGRRERSFHLRLIGGIPMSEEQVFRGSSSHEVSLNQGSGDAVGRAATSQGDDSRRLQAHVEFAPPDDPPALQGVPVPPEGAEPYVPAQDIPPQPPEVLERLTPIEVLANGTEEVSTGADTESGTGQVPEQWLYLSDTTMERAQSIQETTSEINTHLDELDQRLGLVAAADTTESTV
jgi:hypothetical protein